MKRTANPNNQLGIGLIEVLIAAVVIAVGLLSLGSLQGNLMSASGDNKTKAEASQLAEAKIEQLRNNINLADMNSLIVSSSDSINGTNQTFTRTWTVTSSTSPDRKNVAVKVAWGTGADKTVYLTSEIVWSAPGVALDQNTGGNGLTARAPSPNNNSSSTPGESFDLNQITGETALDDGTNLIKYQDTSGHIYLLDSTGKALIKFHGGVIHTIKGRVYKGTVENGSNPSVSLSPLTTYPVTFSDLAYCVFPVHSGQSDYICYFGGDCSKGGAGCSSSSSGLTYEAVLGGWYGKVGLIDPNGVSNSDKLGTKKVCFREDIDSSVTLTANSSARFYSSQRKDSNNQVINSEGINQSFACQDYLVVEKSGNRNNCNLFKTNTNIRVPGYAVSRILGPTDLNVSLAENVDSCGSVANYSVSGTITGSQADLVAVSINGNSCAINTDNATCSRTYNCTITAVNTTQSVTITAQGGGATLSTGSNPVNVTAGQTVVGPTFLAGTAGSDLAYQVTGSVTGNAVGLGYVTVNRIPSSGTPVNCPISGSTYTCSLSSTPTTISVSASNSVTGGSITPSTPQSVVLGCNSTVNGPNYVATAPVAANYAITGTVSGNQSSQVIMSVVYPTLSGNSTASCSISSGIYTCNLSNAIPGTATFTASQGDVNPTSATLSLNGSQTSITSNSSPISSPAFTTSDYFASCNVTVTAPIEKGTGNTNQPDNAAVSVTYSKSAPSGSGSCSIIKATGNYTYSCAAGVVNNGTSITIGGTKITPSSSTVSVTCRTQTISALTGPSLVTTN